MNFSKCEIHFTQHFYLMGLCWNTANISLKLPSDKPLEAQQLGHSLLQTQPVTIHHVMPYWCNNLKDDFFGCVISLTLFFYYLIAWLIQ